MRTPVLPNPRLTLTLPLALTLALTACGGGGSDAGPSATETPIDAPAAAPAAIPDDPAAATAAAPQRTAQAVATTLTDSARAAAAAATAQSTTNDCSKVRPFYWEVGDRNGSKTSGAIQGTTGAAVSPTKPLTIASASKWIYAAYVAEKLNGALSDTDRKFLTLLSGYATFSGCKYGDTVGTCESRPENNVYTAASDGKFDYSGGHMQEHATLFGLSPYAGSGVASEINSRLRFTSRLMYSTEIAGGATITPNDYAGMLRRMMTGELKLGTLLGSNPVCTNPKQCSQAVLTPVPLTEAWHYSLGHWIEDDPTVGDGAFSSPGAFGFYPWIDATKTYYGMVARFQPLALDGGFASVRCGRLIRKAYATGTAG